jgi:hypothetical protein
MRGAALLACALAGCAAAPPPDPDAERVGDAIEIAPYRAHEACVKLADGDRLDWRFESRAPVDFNLHYHEGPSVVMPLSLSASYGGSGVYTVIASHEYCAMFEAGAGGAIVTYRMKPIRFAR